MTTEVPLPPKVGENAVMIGPTVKVCALIAVPPAVVTSTRHGVAPAGTCVTICDEVFELITAAKPLVHGPVEGQPNFTDVALVRFAPPIVTCVPGTPVVGESPEPLIVGAATTKALAAEVCVLFVYPAL